MNDLVDMRQWQAGLVMTTLTFLYLTVIRVNACAPQGAWTDLVDSDVAGRVVYVYTC